LNYNLTEKTYDFLNYYSDENYSILSQTLVNSITILVNNYNNLIEIFTNKIENINIENIIREIDNPKKNYSEYEIDVLKTLNTILVNGEENIAKNFKDIIKNLLIKNREFTFVKFKKLILIFFFICVFFSCTFLFLYIFLYLNLINLRINILKIFTEISEETEEKCMKEVLNYKLLFFKFLKFFNYKPYKVTDMGYIFSKCSTLISLNYLILMLMMKL
jgi:hypothetical protein